MTIDDKMGDEKLQYDINRVSAKASALSSNTGYPWYDRLINHIPECTYTLMDYKSRKIADVFEGRYVE